MQLFNCRAGRSVNLFFYLLSLVLFPILSCSAVSHIFTPLPVVQCPPTYRRTQSQMQTQSRMQARDPSCAAHVRVVFKERKKAKKNKQKKQKKAKKAQERKQAKSYRSRRRSMTKAAYCDGGRDNRRTAKAKREKPRGNCAAGGGLDVPAG